MSNNLEKAKKLLDGKIVFAYVDDNKSMTSDRPGIGFLASITREQVDVSSCAVADKIVGKAAALLFIRLGIKRIFAETISEKAEEVLKKHGAEFSYSEVTPVIQNRTGDGICPMEQTVQSIDDPEQAHEALLKTIEKLRNMAKKNG